MIRMHCKFSTAGLNAQLPNCTRLHLWKEKHVCVLKVVSKALAACINSVVRIVQSSVPGPYLRLQGLVGAHMSAQDGHEGKGAQF